MRSRSLRIVLALLLAALLVGDGAAVFVLTRPPAVRGVTGPQKAELETISRWVERSRGLRFEADIVVDVLSPDAFTAKLRDPATDSPDAAADEVRAVAQADSLFALGVVDRRFSPDDATSTYTAAVTGAYDNQRNRLYLPDVPLTPFRRQVIAHELVHALDDQHFELDRDFGLVNERSLAFRALAEGDARDVEQQYVAAMTPSDRASAEAEEASGGPGDAEVDDLPEGLLAIFSFPYQAGSAFVHALRTELHEAGVDAAFRRPPETTEAIIHPDRWIRGDGPRNTTHPKPDGEVAGRDVLGELGLRLMIYSYGDRAALDAAATGWGGDRTVTWTVPGRTCAAAAIRMDTPQDTDELVAALAGWRTAHPDASFTRSDAGSPNDELSITSCIPTG